MRLFNIVLFLICFAAGSIFAQPSLVMSRSLNGTDQEQYRMIRELRQFSPEDFTEADKNRIAEKILNEETIQLTDYLMLAGYLKLFSALSEVDRERLRTEKLKRSYGLAMVRAGDESKARVLLKNLRGLEYNDDFTYDLVPLLTYTRNREIFDYLIELTLRPNQNCLPPDPHAEGSIDCGYRMMESLAPVLRDFPFELGPSGDLEVDDYPAALKEVRIWLNRHRQDYEILVDHY